MATNTMATDSVLTSDMLTKLFTTVQSKMRDATGIRNRTIGFDMASGATGAERTVVGYRLGSQFLGGLQVIQSVLATKDVEDWSRVRSPSRARRRMKRGHRQNVVIRQQPACFEYDGTLLVHPDYYRQIARQLTERVEADMMRSFLR